MQNILHWRAQERARKCARAINFFRIVKCMKFATFYVFEIFSYLLNWLLWMALKCVLFLNFFKKNLIFLENFQILKIFEKIEFLKKFFKLQIALKNSLFKLWTNKKIATRFFDKFYDSKKIFGARRISHRCENSKIMFFLT